MLILIALLTLGVGAAAQTQAPGVVVTGVVQDQTGAVLQNAPVEIVTAAGAVVQTTTTDGSGAFRFAGIGPGQYELRATFEGFTPAAVRVRVGARGPGSQKLVLNVANLSQEITVSNEASGVTTEARDNRD